MKEKSEEEGRITSFDFIYLYELFLDLGIEFNRSLSVETEWWKYKRFNSESNRSDLNQKK